VVPEASQASSSSSSSWLGQPPPVNLGVQLAGGIVSAPELANRIGWASQAPYTALLPDTSSAISQAIDSSNPQDEDCVDVDFGTLLANPSPPAIPTSHGVGRLQRVLQTLQAAPKAAVANYTSRLTTGGELYLSSPEQERNRQIVQSSSPPKGVIVSGKLYGNGFGTAPPKPPSTYRTR